MNAGDNGRSKEDSARITAGDDDIIGLAGITIHLCSERANVPVAIRIGSGADNEAVNRITVAILCTKFESGCSSETKAPATGLPAASTTFPLRETEVVLASPA